MRLWHVVVVGSSLGCTTLSGVRPLSAGQHEVGVNIGGPFLRFGGPIPFPNLMLGGRSGLPTLAGRPFDLGYGMNATGLPFGVVALYGDLGIQLTDPNGAVPAVTIRSKHFVTANPLGAGKDAGARQGAAYNDMTELYASWGEGSVVGYALFSVANIGGGLALTPGLGIDVDPGDPGGLKLQTELRWWAVNRSSNQISVNWIPSNPGAVGVHVGVAYGFGRK